MWIGRHSCGHEDGEVVRIPFVPLFVIVVLVATLALPSNVAAKTSITVSPESGSPGMTVQIQGTGFPPREDIDIALIALGELSTDPRDENSLIVREASQLSNTLHLATVRADEHTEFIATVTLPSPETIQEAGRSSSNDRFEIIATTPTNGGGIFVARASFTMTAIGLSDTDGNSFFSLPIIFLAAGLAAVAAAVSTFVWRRRTTRRYTGGLTHAHNSH